MKYAVFDFDGTLVKSMHVWRNINKEVLGSYGVQTDIAQYQSEIAGFAMPDTVRYTIKKFNLDTTPEELKAQFMERAERAYEQRDFVRNADKYLEYLHGKGVKIGIATAAPKPLLDAFFSKHQDVAKLVQCVTSCEEVQRNKPDPLVYHVCAKNLGCEDPKQMVIFEDSFQGLEGAANAKPGKVVFVKSDIGDEKAKMKFADQMVEDFADLI